jgi:4-hydroxy-3-polyprenylbenzoate decarboxylase
MADRSLREWIAAIERMGQLKKIKAEVDWNLELSTITRRVVNQAGPALLFENVKGYQNTVCQRVFTNGLGSRERTAVALGLSSEASYREIVKVIKERLGKQVAPVIVAAGPVKQNVIRGKDVNLYEFPVPKYNHLDGGRYINTYAGSVTMDPDTKIMNIGMYRGMIGDNEKSIAVLMHRTRHWGRHFTQYERLGKEMPVAVFYGWDPVHIMCAASPLVHPGYSEYEIMGSLREEPVELVKCETSDLYVPASAEIVIEGRMSPDPKTFQLEGPFGEYTGFHGGERRPKPVIRVECITHRDDPIYRAFAEGNSPGQRAELQYWAPPMSSAVIWRSLEQAGVPNITGVWGSAITSLMNLRIQIDKLYRGHAKQVAAAVWGLGSQNKGKNLIVVDKDIDIFDDEAIEWAMAWRTNAEMGDIQFFRGTIGESLDPSTPFDQRDPMKYGAGKSTRVFIDATVNWDLEPQEQYGGRREPPLCTDTLPEITDLVSRRWKEYGI